MMRVILVMLWLVLYHLDKLCQDPSLVLRFRLNAVHTPLHLANASSIYTSSMDPLLSDSPSRPIPYYLC